MGIIQYMCTRVLWPSGIAPFGIFRTIIYILFNRGVYNTYIQGAQEDIYRGGLKKHTFKFRQHFNFRQQTPPPPPRQNQTPKQTRESLRNYFLSVQGYFIRWFNRIPWATWRETEKLLHFVYLHWQLKTTTFFFEAVIHECAGGSG